ncbi:MAG: DRTGG domain-containing protein [Candidatus Bipolaricaulota bacterium]|nr:DRTGG domain-containing protein [Candidatus Bipolaricaulota bacterium]
MELGRVVSELGLEPLATGDLTRDVQGGYACDLLSDVLAHAEAGDLWITHQRHLNVVAVAKLRDLAGVIFARGNRPSPDVVARAAQEGVNLFLSSEPAFEVAGRLHRLLHP